MATAHALKTPPLTLELESEEVEVLAAILAKIGGDPSSPNRQLAEGILGALTEILGFDAEDGLSYPGPATPDARFSGTLTARP